MSLLCLRTYAMASTGAWETQPTHQQMPVDLKHLMESELEYAAAAGPGSGPGDEFWDIPNRISTELLDVLLPLPAPLF